MYRVLVVEDEPLEMIALCGKIERLYPGEFEILKAEDGDLALTICKNQRPEIVLVDINIPGIEGLELIRILTEEKFKGKFLIVTAYDTSEYIRKALTLGVAGYLLKPVCTKELKNEMEKCKLILKNEWEQNKKEISQKTVLSYAQQYLVGDIIEGRFPQETLEKVYGWRKDGELSIYIVILKRKAKSEIDFPEIDLEGEAGVLKKFFTVLSTEMKGKKLLFLNPRFPKEREKSQVLLQIWLEKVWKQMGKEGYLSCSLSCDTYQEICENAKRLLGRTLKERNFIDGLMVSKSGNQDRDRLAKKWEQRIREGKAENLIRAFRRKASDSDDYWGYASVLLNALNRLDHSIDGLEIFEILSGEKPYAQLGEWLENYCDKQAKEKGKIQFVLKFMEEHYGEALMRGELAEQLGLNETYFSYLFKRETGKNFVSALTEIRIKHAKELLDKPGLEMEEIAKQCGYYNKKYFFEVFKRVTGVAITDYVRKLK